MIRYVVFSDNEAFKLKAFIERARQFLPSANLQIAVQCSDEHREAYELVMTEMAIPLKGNGTYGIMFVESGQFHRDVTALFEEGKEELVCLITTDDMLFAPVDESLIVKEFEDPKLLSFGLRLGKNITRNSMVNMSNKVVPISENDQTMKWDWTKHYVDFSAPLSVHGHYFRQSEIKKMVRACKNATSFVELEEMLQRFMNYPKQHMASFLESKAVSINPIFDPVLEKYVKDALDNGVLRHNNVSIVTDYEHSVPNELHAPLLEGEIRKATT